MDPGEVLQWDSAFFECKVGRLCRAPGSPPALRAAEDWWRGQALDCVYCLVDRRESSAAALLEKANFHIRDLRLTFSAQLSGSAQTSPSIRSWRESDLVPLSAIARTAHTNSRFFADSGFRREKVDEFYPTWIRNSCAGFADAVLVDDAAGIVNGYVTLHQKSLERVSIGLIGVAEASRNLGVGQRLVSAAIAWSVAAGCSQIDVVTQGSNVEAQRLYVRCGFLPCEAAWWYHGWPRAQRGLSEPSR